MPRIMSRANKNGDCGGGRELVSSLYRDKEDVLSTLPRGIAKDVKEAVDILRRHGASRIVLYGSLARGDYHLDSDIDIGVEGIPDREYFRAVAECLMDIPRRVSLVDLRDTYGVFRARIDKEGEVLYERRRSSRRDRVRVE